jgi:transposase
VGQLGFYDLDRRLKALSAKGDPLVALNAIVPFESFRAEIEAVVRLAPEERKSNAGRKPFDAVMMFKVLVLQTLYNLADEQVEYQVRDRLSFMRFLGLGLEDVVPDATTVWLFREALTKTNLVKALFDRFNGHLNAKGYIARGGQIVDASIVSAPRQHNTREENAAVKAGKTPEGWEEKPAKNAQNDKDARWTKKNDKSFEVAPDLRTAGGGIKLGSIAVKPPVATCALRPRRPRRASARRVPNAGAERNKSQSSPRYPCAPPFRSRTPAGRRTRTSVTATAAR